jgi:hypothetical protein
MKLPWWYPIILAGLVAMTGACRTKPGTTSTGTPKVAPKPNPIVEMLVSERAEVVAEGELLLAAEQDQLFDRLLKDAASGEAKASGRAAVELGILLSPWLRGKEAGERFVEYINFPSPRRPVERLPDHPRAAEIREALQSSIDKLIHQPTASNESSVADALEALSETLGEVANDATMDWALEQLAKGGDVPAYRMDPLCDLATSYVGMPPVSSKGGMCGNSTSAEFAKFREMEKQRVAGACTTLQKAWNEVQPMTPKDRIGFSIHAWRDHLVPLQNQYSGSFNPRGYLFEVMESLVRFGEPAIPCLRAQQRVETELEVKGVWEVMIAAISGKEDPALVKSLFEGGGPHPKLACEVIVAAGSKAWLKELEELQMKKGSDGAPAGHATAINHGIEGLPSLEKDSSSSFNEGLIRELKGRKDGKLHPDLRRHYTLFGGN